MNHRNKRINSEIQYQLIPIYGSVNWDFEDYRWVHILNFPLPEGWNAPFCDLLLELPSAYPEVPPSKFYLPKGLRDRYHRMTGHYFERGGDLNPYSHKNWAYLCLHMKSWNSYKDTMLTMCQVISAYLKEK